MLETILIVVSLLVGAGGGYAFFRYVLKKKYLRMIEVSGEDVKASRARIAKLIREVDKCIALLDV